MLRAVLLVVSVAAVILSGSAGDPGLALVSFVFVLLSVLIYTPFVASRVARLVHRIRRPALLFCCTVWLYTLVVLVIWLGVFQWAWGIALNGRAVVFPFICGWLWLFLVGCQLSTEELRQMGATLAKRRATGPLLACVVLSGCFIGAEIGMRLFMVQSDGFDFTAGHRAWQNVYWKPINHLGYRDYEPNTDPAYRHILVVGDSVTAGQGVNRVEDTFPYVLEQNLKARYKVNLVAQPGWETDTELEALKAYPVHPDTVIVSYMLNDIAYLLPTTNGMNLQMFQFPQDAFTAWWVRNFFTVSFVYWDMVQVRLHNGDSQYTASMYAAYANNALWDAHKVDLLKFVTYAQQQHASLIVLIWPYVQDLDGSTPYTQKVEDFFKSHGAATVNMGKVLKGRDWHTLVANPFDAHPNAAVHATAGEQLARLITP